MSRVFYDMLGSVDLYVHKASSCIVRVPRCMSFKFVISLLLVGIWGNYVCMYVSRTGEEGGEEICYTSQAVRP